MIRHDTHVSDPTQKSMLIAYTVKLILCLGPVRLVKSSVEQDRELFDVHCAGSSVLQEPQTSTKTEIWFRCVHVGRSELKSKIVLTVTSHYLLFSIHYSVITNQ